MTDPTLQQIPLELIDPHPDNPRPIDPDHVAALAALMTASGYDPAAPLLLQPRDDGRYRIVSGHHRTDAARAAGLDTAVAEVRVMTDAEAHRLLVTLNNQKAIDTVQRAINFWEHVERYPAADNAGRGQTGGARDAARSYGYKKSYADKLVQIGRIATESAHGVGTSAATELAGYAEALYALRNAPDAIRPILRAAMIDKQWSAADVEFWIARVAPFDIPDRWAHWLPLQTVVARFVDTERFAPSSVSKLIATADQVIRWVETDVVNADPEAGLPTADEELARFNQWLAGQGEEAWDARRVAGYLAGRIAERMIPDDPEAADWHHGRWQDHLDKLADGSVSLLLTDPPYGVGYQSNMRTDTRQPKRHDKIVGDATLEEACEGLSEVLRALGPKLTADATVFVFCSADDDVHAAMKDVVRKAGFTVRKRSLVWDKLSGGTGDLNGTMAPAHEMIIHATSGSPTIYYRGDDVLRHARIDAVRHTTEKPEPLLVELIERVTVAGQIVADPFGGVASTAAAAKATGRRWWSCEIDDTHWADGEERLL